MTEIAIFISLAYLIMCSWTIWFDMKKPIFMPFSIFRAICSFGYKAPIADSPEKMDGLNKFAFSSADFQEWLVCVNDRGSVTNLEFFVFSHQRVVEINAELLRRGLK